MEGGRGNGLLVFRSAQVFSSFKGIACEYNINFDWATVKFIDLYSTKL